MHGGGGRPSALKFAFRATLFLQRQSVFCILLGQVIRVRFPQTFEFCRNNCRDASTFCDVHLVSVQTVPFFLCRPTASLTSWSRCSAATRRPKLRLMRFERQSPKDMIRRLPVTRKCPVLGHSRSFQIRCWCGIRMATLMVFATAR